MCNFLTRQSATRFVTITFDSIIHESVLMPRLQELSTLSYLEEALSNRHVPPKTSTWEREMSLGHQCEFGTYRLRIRTVEGSDDEVVIHEDLSLISTRVWDCSVLVAKWLENIATRYQETPDLSSALDLPLTSSTRDRPLNVLELGAGTGLLSVCLAKMGAAVLSTEYGVSVKYLQQNIDLNKIADSQSTRQMKWTPKSGVVSCRELDWYNASETLETLFAEGHQSVFDMIVVTDCSLTRRDSQGFMEMIHKYGTKNYTKVILGLCHEREGTPYCVENVPKEFRDVVKISEEAWHPDFKSQRHMIFTFKA